MFQILPSSFNICNVYAIKGNIQYIFEDENHSAHNAEREGGRVFTWIWLHHICNEYIVTVVGGNRNEFRESVRLTRLEKGKNRFHRARRGNLQSINDTV